MDAEYYDDLAGRLYGLLIVLEVRLAGEQAQLHHFIEVGEYGLALEEIADALAQEKRPAAWTSALPWPGQLAVVSGFTAGPGMLVR